MLLLHPGRLGGGGPSAPFPPSAGMQQRSRSSSLVFPGVKRAGAKAQREQAGRRVWSLRADCALLLLMLAAEWGRR